MATLLLTFKALHVVGFVSWFAGLFYLVRMFVYQREALDQEEPKRSILKEEFETMQHRVYKIICNPAMMATFFFGIGMLVLNPAYLQLGWMHVKLTLLIGLLGYHLYCKRIMKEQAAGTSRWEPFQLRLFNEVSTLFLVAISFIAVLGKANLLNYLYLLIGLLAFTGLILYGAWRYKQRREAGLAR